MPTVKLSTKAYNGSQLRKTDENLKTMLKGLKVEAKTLMRTTRGWVEVSVAGEDQNIAIRYLAEKIGLCPTNSEISKFFTTKGYLIDPNNSKTELGIDVGINETEKTAVSIPVKSLQTQLCDGKKIPLTKITGIFGLCKNLPITIKILNVDKATGNVEAELAEKQQKHYQEWTKSLLDRLIVIGASQDAIKLALKETGLTRDTTDVEPLGFFEHAIVCKLGTDAKGLIPRIGRRLREASFTVFSPKKILNTLENRSTST